MIIASTILLTLGTPANAASACHTLEEARSTWRGSYLRYHVDGRKPHGAKCWFPGDTTARVIRARLPMPRPSVDMTPQQRIDAVFGSIILVDIDPPGWFTIRARQLEAY